MQHLRTIILLILSIFLTVTRTEAHPGIGIVANSKGNIYYTDLQQVWKIDKAMKKTIAVPHVHTHDLYMQGDYLFGEDLQYEGEASNKYSHYLLRLGSNGKLDTIFGPSQAYVSNDYTFTKDDLGNEFFRSWPNQDRIIKRTSNGKEVVLTTKSFKNIG